MMSVALLVVTAAFGYALDAIFVGMLFGLLIARIAGTPSTRAVVICMLFAFTFLDNYWWPVTLVLDATITIRNEAIAGQLGFRPDEPLQSLFSPGLFDLVVWFMQTWLALAIGKRIATSRRGAG